MLEKNMRKLFQTNKGVTNTGAPNPKIILTKASFLQYKQFLLTKKFQAISRNDHRSYCREKF